MRHTAVLLLVSPLLASALLAQNGLSGRRVRSGPQGAPEFQLGILGSRTGGDGLQVAGGGFLVGLRLPVRSWLFADFQTGHLYQVSHTDVVCTCDPPVVPSTGPFTRTTSELTEALPLAVPTGFFAARLSGQFGPAAGTQLRLQLGARHRNASHTWLPTAGVAIKLPSRSAPFVIDLEAARYQIQYRDVREDYLDGVLTNRTTSASTLAPRRGIELMARLSLAFGPAAASGRRRGR